MSVTATGNEGRFVALNKTKRSHWVPRGYLRAFAAAPEKIWTYSKYEGDPALRPIEKVAVKFYIYAPGRPGARDYSFEDRLAVLEQLFGMDYWKVLCTDMVDLRDPHLRKGVALLVAVMYLRNPRRLAQVRSMHEKMVAAFSRFPEPPDVVEMRGKEYSLDKSSWPAYRDADEEAVQRMWLDIIGSAGWLAEFFLKMRWAIVFADKPAFITTDNPVISLHESQESRGFRDPDTTIVFPLSPTRALSMDWRHAESDGQYYPLKGTAGSFNLLMWRSAIETMFADRHPDEVCAEMSRAAQQQDVA